MNRKLSIRTINLISKRLFNCYLKLSGDFFIYFISRSYYIIIIYLNENKRHYIFLTLQNVNGNFGGPGKQGGWSQGNKQGTIGQQRGPRGDFNKGQGGPGQGQGGPGQGPARNQPRINSRAGGQFDGKPVQREVIIYLYSLDTLGIF